LESVTGSKIALGRDPATYLLGWSAMIGLDLVGMYLVDEILLPGAVVGAFLDRQAEHAPRAAS